MDFSRLCINCMKEKEPEQNICPHCHFDQSTYVMPPYVLTPYTVLNGRYLVGKVLGKGGFGITYIAMDMMLESGLTPLGSSSSGMTALASLMKRRRTFQSHNSRKSWRVGMGYFQDRRSLGRS